MKKNNLISMIILIAGIIIALTGVSHIAATPMAYKTLQSDPIIQGEQAVQKIKGLVYFFMVCGLLFVFTSMLITYCASGLKRKERWAQIISLMSAFIVALAALPALLYARFNNPLIYLDVFFSAIVIGGIMVSKATHQQTN